jgi:hypothetical protein
MAIRTSEIATQNDTAVALIIVHLLEFLVEGLISLKTAKVSHRCKTIGRITMKQESAQGIEPCPGPTSL